jgi:hypothetical protein
MNDHDALIAALQDALDGLEDMYPYVPEYFRDKWDHAGYIDRARATLRDHDHSYPPVEK